MKRLKELGADAPIDLQPLVTLVEAARPAREGAHKRVPGGNSAWAASVERRSRRRWVSAAAIAVAFAAAAGIRVAIRQTPSPPGGPTATVHRAAAANSSAQAGAARAAVLTSATNDAPSEPERIASGPVEHTPGRRALRHRTVAAPAPPRGAAARQPPEAVGSAPLSAPMPEQVADVDSVAPSRSAPAELSPQADTGDELLVLGLRALHREHRPAAARALASTYLTRFEDGPLAREAWLLLIDAAEASGDSDVAELTARYRARFETTADIPR